MNRKDRIKNFGRMLFEGMGNISFDGMGFDTPIDTGEAIYVDTLLGIHGRGLTGPQIDAVKLAREVQATLNSTRGVFTENKAAQMIQTKDDMYNMYKKQFERNAA